MEFNAMDRLHCDKKGSRLHCTINPTGKDDVVHKYNSINVAGDYIELMNEDEKHLDIIFEKRAICQSLQMAIDPDKPRKLFGTLACASTKERDE